MKMGKIKNKKKVAIFVDGECELWYLQMMKRNENALNIDLLPKLPRKKKLLELYKEVKNSANDYDLVIWIVDLDKIREEERSKKKGGDSPKEEFIKYYDELSQVDNVEIIVSNPCLEYWLLLHFEYTAKPFTNCNEANVLLKKHIKDYDKSEKFYVKNDLYKKLKANQQDAVKHAKKLGEFDVENFDSSVCEMFKIFDSDEDVNILKGLD